MSKAGTSRKQRIFLLFDRRVDHVADALERLSYAGLDAAMSDEHAARRYESHLLGWDIVPIAERLDADTVQIVVQGFRRCPYFFGSQVYVRGFRRFRDGRLEQMTDDELLCYD